MTTVTISLPESLKEFVDRQLATKGLASGEDIPVTPEFWSELRTEARQIAEKHKAKKRS